MNSNFQELKVRIENAEAVFVEYLCEKKTLSKEECQLMDDILETKEAILELLKEEKGKQQKRMSKNETEICAYRV